MASYIQQTCPTPIWNLAAAAIDGLTRGTTICALPSLLAAAKVPATWWTTALLSAIAINGGGLSVQLLGLDQEDWKLGMPAVLKGGILNTLDFWGGAMTGLLYASLLRLHPQLAPISDLLATALPADLRPLGANAQMGAAVTTPGHARAIAVLFLSALFIARVVTLMVLAPTQPVAAAVSRKRAKKMDKVDKEILEAVVHEKIVEPELAGHEKKEKAGIETPETKNRSRAGTPRKSAKVKSS